MAALPHWEDEGQPWDKLILGDNVMPGVWAIVSGDCSRQVDHKKTKNKDKAVIKDLGLLPPRLQAKGKLCTREDWEALQQIMPDINPRKAGGPKFPLKIYHPAAAILGVSTIYVERIKPPEIDNGVLTFEIDMIEWTEQPKKVQSGHPKNSQDDPAVMVEQLRGAGQWRTSTLKAANNPEAYAYIDPDIAALTGRDYRNAPEFSAVNINPADQSSEVSGLGLEE
jgi:hypothetical protein